MLQNLPIHLIKHALHLSTIRITTPFIPNTVPIRLKFCMKILHKILQESFA